MECMYGLSDSAATAGRTCSTYAATTLVMYQFATLSNRMGLVSHAAAEPAVHVCCTTCKDQRHDQGLMTRMMMMLMMRMLEMIMMMMNTRGMSTTSCDYWCTAPKDDIST